jgi:hypothetical protein
LCGTNVRLSKFRELIVKKNILIGLAILAISTSGAFAKKHAMKPKAAPAAAASSPAPMMGQVSAADKAMYKKNLHDSGIKKK